MRKKLWAGILSAAMATTMLVGCGDSMETGGSVQNTTREDRESEEVRKEAESGESLFPDTIFDNIEILDTSLGDVEKLFDARGLAYENPHRPFVNTTITDEFGDWEAQYFCDFTVPPDYVVSDNVVIDGQIYPDRIQELPKIELEEMTLSQWTTILFLDEDSEYRDAVKLIQSVIDQNKLDSYDYLDVSYYYLQQFYGLDNYKCDEVVCYPIKTLEYAGMDCLEYLLFGKIPNYNKNDVSHVIFFSVGIMLEQNYQEGVLLPISIDYVSLATLWSLEIYDETGNNTGNIPLSQTATYPLTDWLMIQLKPTVDANGSSTGASMIIFYMSLAMNTEHKDYKTMGSAEKLASFEIEIKDVVASVIQNYTEQECRDNLDGQIRAEILDAIQDLFQSDFIYRISISDVMFQ